ncbi:MAG: hypothetical protein J0I57_02920 [Hyphomicrobium sp.]|nr:hypothetical protein [Hyphomicrobium sp.]MBN9276571.1 hypothetical protein [Hyphomicrobium sp.]
MKPRITIAISKDGVLEIYLNEAGRARFVEELTGLSRERDHFHLQPEGNLDEVPLQMRPYNEGDQVIEFGKVLFRPDDWDAQYFPHVL